MPIWSALAFLVTATGSHFDSPSSSWVLKNSINSITTDIKDGGLDEVDQGTSCALSIRLDTLQPCFTECVNDCNLDEHSTIFKTADCYLPLCAQPSGIHTKFRPFTELSQETGFLTDSFAELSSNIEWHPFGEVVEKKLDTTASLLNYHRSIVLDSVNINRLIDPYRLSFSSFSTNNRMVPSQKGLYASYVRVGREIGDLTLTYYREFDDDKVWETRWYPSIGEMYNQRMPFTVYDGSILLDAKIKFIKPGRATTDTEDEDDIMRSYPHGPEYKLQTIHQLIQQWFLRYGDDIDDPRMVITRTRSYPYYDQQMYEKIRENERGSNVNAIGFNSTEDSDEMNKFESMVTTSYSGLNVSPECADRNNCAACVASGICAWCDMTSANIKTEPFMYGGWFRDSKARQANGSACGVPPIICSMLGGEPTTQSCPVLWKDDWDQKA